MDNIALQQIWRQDLTSVPPKRLVDPVEGKLTFYEKCGMVRGDKTAFIKRF